MKIPDVTMHTDRLVMQFAGFTPVVVNPLRSEIRMAGRYATDWPEAEAQLVVEFVKVALPDSLQRMSADVDGRWWVCDDTELPERPGVPVAMGVR